MLNVIIHTFFFTFKQKAHYSTQLYSRAPKLHTFSAYILWSHCLIEYPFSGFLEAYKHYFNVYEYIAEMCLFLSNTPTEVSNTQTS